MIEFKYYEENYFYEIEKLILNSYQYDMPLWGLSRHEFCRAFHPDFKDAKHAWGESMGLYFEDEKLISAVLSEGAYDGDAFFLFDSLKRTKDNDLLKRMVIFAITHLSKISDNREIRTLYLNVPTWHAELNDIVLSLGFKLGEHKEKVNILPFDHPFSATLPKEFHFAKEQVPAFYLSNIHRNAFNYGLPHAERGSAAFSKLREMKHYDKDLEVVVLDSEMRPVGFAIGWMNPSMPYAELEPMAVTWWQRRKGLGSAIIHELANRIMAKYPHAKGMTGGDQPFYASIGFVTQAEVPVYIFEKEIHISWDPRSKDENYNLPL